MAKDGEDSDKSNALESSVNFLGKAYDKAKSAADSLKEHEGNRAVETVVSQFWVLAVKIVAFWLPFMLITVVGSTTNALSVAINETLIEVNQTAPDGKLFLFWAWVVISLIIAWFFAISHHGKPAFYYFRVGLIAGLVVNFLVTISPIGSLLMSKFL